MHGTFLLGFDLPLVEECLSMPSLEPDYRESRTHADFITNLGISSAEVKNALRKQWEAHEPLQTLPKDDVRALAENVYATDAWNRKF